MNLLTSTVLAAFLSLGPGSAVIAPAVSSDPGSEGLAFEAPVDDASGVLTFELIDLNGDAVITPDELAEWFVSDDPSTDAFDVFDTDLNGVVTPFEFEAVCVEPDVAIEV